ncbi:hypothetical protein evm_006088 [Chilo suppressalis]|nr:hypothetical protein evm_006088 [Chilo suppressalis]
MENLYDNLENYEDENIVAELRRENAELKCKLEEYSETLDKLQKDFDKVSAEFKKLEINYSSLLKTAKQEIERKTQIITKLNIEKDMMVLNAIQNKNMPRRIINRNQNSELEKAKQTNIERSKTNDIHNNERNKQKHLSSEETTTSASTDNIKDCVSKNLDRLSSTCQNEKKENIAKEDIVKPKPLSISNRRKSMPALRAEAKFSSDEDDEDRDYCTTSSKFHKSNHDLKPPYVTKTFHDKNRLLDDRYRTSETSSMDDKYSSYHKYNKDFRNRNSRYDSYKNRNREPQKYKRHFSPEKSRRNTRNYLDDHNSRQEFKRHRVLESPSPDRGHNYQRWNREVRTRYDTDEYNDKDKFRGRHQENYAGKHKLPNHNEEPMNKRRRNDSYHNREEEKSWIEDRVPIQTSVSVEQINQMDCQSPDYPVIPESASTQPVREIRYTAVMKLEDPRLLSKRYIMCQGDKNLSAITGRNIDFKAIDTSCWNMERVELPKALTRRPSQCSEDLVQNIYMDIENPVSNLSMESGEIGSFDRDELETFDTAQPFHHKLYNYDHASLKNTASETASEKIPTLKEDSEYKMSKLNQLEKNQVSVDKPKDDFNQLKEKNIVSMEMNRCNIPEEKREYLTKNVHERKIFDKKDPNSLDRLDDTDNLNTKKIEQHDLKSTGKHTVEGDLELSDETNDNDAQKKLITEIDIRTVKDVTTENEFMSENHSTEANKGSGVLDLQANPKSINEDTKKSKSKRKSQKSLNKEISKKDDAVVIREKRTRSKKDKKEVKEIKTKFSELFGDTTSSLITPDDLGLPTVETQSQTVQYIPICEDAQDAVLQKPIDIPNKKDTITTNDANNIECEGNIGVKLPEKCISGKPNNIKKKKSKKKETEKTVSSNQTETDPKPTCDKSSGEVKKDTSEYQNHEYNVDEAHKTNNLQNVLLQKPDLLLKALATSTPQKEIKENPVVLPIVITGNSTSNPDCVNNYLHNIVVSIDDNNTGTDQTSNNETLDSQTEVDAPDVRIFVKRRRKVMRKSKPS